MRLQVSGASGSASSNSPGRRPAGTCTWLVLSRSTAKMRLRSGPYPTTRGSRTVATFRWGRGPPADYASLLRDIADQVGSLAPWETVDVAGVAVGFDDGDFQIVYER